MSREFKMSETNLVYYTARSALYLFFISDALTKVLTFAGADYNRISILVRSFYELIFLFFLVAFFNVRKIVLLVILAVMFICFIIGQYYFSKTFIHTYPYMANIAAYHKYFFVFILYSAMTVLKDHPDKLERLMRLMMNLFTFNSLSIFAGFILQFGFLKSYMEQHYRFGYSGWIPAPNEATFFYFIAFSLAYYRHFILKIPTTKTYIILIAGLLIGTKGILLFASMLLLFHLFRNSGYKAKVASMLIILALIVYIPRFLASDQAKIILEYFISKIQLEGVWFTLSSGRTLYLQQFAGVVTDRWTLVNYMFGGENQAFFMVEMDFLDLFLFMGFVGGVVYLGLLAAYLFRFSYNSAFNLFFVFTYMAMAFLGGHFFGSAMNALYLALTCLYISASQRTPEQAHG